MTFAEMRTARITAMIDDLGLEAVDDLAARFEQAYTPAYTDCLRAFPDVRPALDELAAAGVRIGALTNSDGAATARKLQLTGLADDFTMIVTTDSLGFGKPDPRVFEHACELLGSEPAQTVYVGDHVEIDALGAVKAGLVGVWLRREGPDGPRRDPRRAEDDALAQAHGIPVITSLAEVTGFVLGTREDPERSG
jgi:putative hydrolase of the HAD superfamily